MGISNDSLPIYLELTKFHIKWKLNNKIKKIKVGKESRWLQARYILYFRSQHKDHINIYLISYQIWNQRFHLHLLHIVTYYFIDSGYK